MSLQKKILLEVKNMHKSFGPTIALDGVNLTVKTGEVHGLVGENGSGKSTVTSIIAGLQKCDKGDILYLGENWNSSNMIDSQQAGISMILQEENTISNVSVAENLLAGKESDYTHLGFVSKKKMIDSANQLLKDFGIEHIKAEDNINKYGFEDRKLIELCRVITKNTKILVVDETTTALSHVGRELLYKLIQKMVNEEKAVIFISHDMDEILEVCNILTVLRDGKIIGTLEKEQMEPKKIRYMMVGREIGEAYYRSDYDASHSKEVVLEFNNASFKQISNLNLKLYKGQILGIGGLSGSGMRDIGRAAFGLEPLIRGTVTCNGQQITNVKSAIDQNIAYISKNRDYEALIGEASIQDNIIMPSVSMLSGKGMFLSKKKTKQVALDQIEKFNIKCENQNQLVSTLSGGNKQKVSFAKWTAKNSEIFIMDCPTRGVDIGVKQFMYQLMIKMKAENKAILMITEELSELIGMCDDIIVFKEHEISAHMSRNKTLKQTDIIKYII